MQTGSDAIGSARAGTFKLLQHHHMCEPHSGDSTWLSGVCEVYGPVLAAEMWQPAKLYWVFAKESFFVTIIGI